MDWSAKRKLFYALGVIFLCVVSSIYIFRDHIFIQPSCIDGKKNGYESGIDCGGTCALICKQDVIPLTVLWSQAIQTGTSTYDFVAMISNKNIDTASRYLTYTFTGYDREGNSLAVIKGTTTAPRDGDFPIIKQNILVSGTIINVTSGITDTSHYKVPLQTTVSPFKISKIKYDGDGDVKRTTASITNMRQTIFRNIPVKAILYDSKDTAYAVGETLIPYLGKEEERQITFSWPYELKESPTKIRIYPLLDPFIQYP